MLSRELCCAQLGKGNAICRELGIGNGVCRKPFVVNHISGTIETATEATINTTEATPSGVLSRAR